MDKQKINILYLHNISEISGGERSLLNLWENLDRNRFCPFLMLPESGALSCEAEKLGISVSYLSVPQLRPLNGIKILKACRYLREYLVEHNIHIIHSYTPRNNILSALVGKSLNIPVIWHERNMIFGDEWDATRKFLFLPNRVICNSSAVAQRFSRKGKVPDKVKVILNGVNLDRFQPVDDRWEFKKRAGVENQRVVGIVTNLSERKRVSFFLEIAAEVHKDFKDVRFLVIGGEFPDMQGKRILELKAMAGKLGLEDSIIFTDFQDDIRPFLYALDVFVHVAVKEACSRAILEAMAASLPVVAVKDGGNPELVEDGQTGLLMDAYDKEGFVRAVIGLLEDDFKRSAMAAQCRKRIEELFDVKRNARQTEEIYHELISEIDHEI